jgi:uncharacterized protein YdiU (UPF0061 family)
MVARPLRAESARQTDCQMYEKFKCLDGQHPWRQACPDGYVDYHVRTRAGGRVVYFNYDLAREMELIPANHADQLTRALEQAIVDAFSLQIINEYDLANGALDSNDKTIRPHPYMATRYLQAQHKDKRGLNSGDGRAIWNGIIKTAKKTYDVSSRGTGATRLSPGAQIATGPVKTGDDSWGYSCGRADLDEMLGTALMSEAFHRSGFPTERTLAIIDFDDGTAIGVRAAPNLIRPAHIFRYLKQGRHAELKASLDYFIDRQVANGEWKLPRDPKERYRRALTYIARAYGKLAAICEEEYIFNWLAWDGDNMLASGAILDYGSIRQFAAKHDKYRYDDVDRFSSTLTEQRHWARELVKVFAQAAHFARTGRKLNLQRFRNVRCLKQFDAFFEREREARILWRLGFTHEQIEMLRKRGRSEIGDLRRALSFFEEVKVARGIEKLADGITHSPVFLIRNLLRELPAFYLNECNGEFGKMMEPQRFCQTMAASYASRRDLKMTQTRVARAMNFQKCYQRLAAVVGRYDQVLKQLVERSAVINYERRMTGNAIINVVNEIATMKDDLSRKELQSAMERFIESQVLIPGQWKPVTAEDLKGTNTKSRLLQAMENELEECKEFI